MQGGLNSGHNRQGSAYTVATSTEPTDPVTNREAVRVGSVSLTMEELLALAVVVNALGTLVVLYMEVS
ncbi:hypothetical protein [Haloarchaeobius salinus]|uniref:hypothetical protein n=1 Tax=Haloarchaeobius salinus TaxID=1198298 RepID=UPI00210ED3B3|nr:hypothetical protein [Haloarchaeobius salinus]